MAGMGIWMMMVMMGVIMVMLMMMTDADAFHVMMVTLLGHACFRLKAQKLRSVFAETAVHTRIAGKDLIDAFDESLDHQIVVAQIRRLDEFDFRKGQRSPVHRLINSLHENPGEQEIRKYGDAAIAEPCCVFERGKNQRKGHTGIGCLSPTEA